MNQLLWAALDLDLNWYVSIGVKAVSAVGAAIVGYMLGGPIFGALTRLAFHRPPGAFVTWAGKLLCAGVAACLAWLLVNLGMGGGFGFGFGPGAGGGAGLGPGKGGDGVGTNNQVTSVDGKENKDNKDGKSVTPLQPPRDIVQIVLLGGEKFKGDGKYYLVNREANAKDIIEVQNYFEKNKGRLEVQIVLTPESVSENHTAVKVLQHVAQKFEFPTVIRTQ